MTRELTTTYILKRLAKERIGSISACKFHILISMNMDRGYGHCLESRPRIDRLPAMCARPFVNGSLERGSGPSQNRLHRYIRERQTHSVAHPVINPEMAGWGGRKMECHKAGVRISSPSPREGISRIPDHVHEIHIDLVAASVDRGNIFIDTALSELKVGRDAECVHGAA
jgi:hypothetical protein